MNSTAISSGCKAPGFSFLSAFRFFRLNKLEYLVEVAAARLDFPSSALRAADQAGFDKTINKDQWGQLTMPPAHFREPRDLNGGSAF